MNSFFRTIRFRCIVCLAALLVCSTSLHAAENIMADGLAEMAGRESAAARSMALEDAFRNAVEQAVGDLVEADVLAGSGPVIADRILARPSAYIERYAIDTEGVEESLYHVTINAEIGPELANDLAALGLLRSGRTQGRQRAAEKPKLLVMIDEKIGGLYDAAGADNAGQTEALLIGKFIGAGFSVIDSGTVRVNLAREKALRIFEGDNGAAAAEALKYGAQVIVTGSGFSKSAGGGLYGTHIKSIQATLQLRVVRADTATVMASRTAQGTQAHIDELQGGVLALKEAAESVADDLVALIGQQWASAPGGSGQELTVMISGLASYRHLSAIKQILGGETKGIAALKQLNFTGGTAELSVQYGGRAEDLAEDLAKRKFKGFRLEPTRVSPGRIDLKAVVGK